MGFPQKPSMGRIVHYVHEDGLIRPAIIVHVWDEGSGPGDGSVQLQVFNDSDPEGSHNDGRPSVEWQTSVVFDGERNPNTWHWPEKV